MRCIAIRKFWVIVYKDLLFEWRSKDWWLGMVTFVLMVLLVFAFAFDSLNQVLRQMFPGMLWMTFLFTGILGINKAFQREEAEDTLTGLFLAPGDRLAVYAAKMTVAFLFMLVTELISIPAFFIIFDERVAMHVGGFFAILVLGALGMVEIATLLAAISIHVKNGDMLLSLLVIPLQIPVLIMAVQATAGVLMPNPPHLSLWIHGLIAYDLIFLALGLMLSDYLWEV
ncbi:heme exporter protein CcmB [Sulfobacillus thermosulfidooxidans]|uniref:heme exporter protein CcmB n=1 Tax=Sulfobacillus thermosulfidooxidans TaxID=28034 RepID=UPI0006B60F05|nr:heme exporter protein CcmB [Sulfobacillus thermosulfidooxidans]